MTTTLSEPDPRLTFRAERSDAIFRLLPLVLATFQGLIMSRLWSGNLFNSYPYISDDGFDWLTQGLAFNQLVSGEDGRAWPVLRQPMFVFVSSLDAVLGSIGIAFVLIQSAAVGVTAYLLMQFARRRCLGNASAVAITLAWYFFVFGFYRLWVLSDTIAAAFMTCSVVLALHEFEQIQKFGVTKARVWKLVPGMMVTALAGLTQTYGLIPFLVICAVNFYGAALNNSRSLIATSVASAALPSAVVFGGQYLWASVVPHETVPTQFGLLQISGDMVPFYLNLWPFVFLPLLPALVFGTLSRWRWRRAISLTDLSILAATATFVLLSFFYQWEESRLTFMYSSILFLATIAWCCPAESVARRESPAILISSAASLLVGLLVVPGDYWRPNLASARLDPGGTWLASALRDSPQDRYFLQTQCGGMNELCERAVIEEQPSPYRARMFEEYKRRMSAEGLPAS